jgi:hypothetical protein
MKYRRRLFDPFITLWAFLSQMLDTIKVVLSLSQTFCANQLQLVAFPCPKRHHSGYC